MRSLPRRFPTLLLLLLLAPSAPAVTDFLSPDGARVAFASPEHGSNRTGRSEIFVADLATGIPRRVLSLDEPTNPTVHWLDEHRLAVLCPNSNRFAVFTPEGEPRAPILLPRGCSVGDHAFSPGGRRLAIRGSLRLALDETINGLLLVDLARGDAEPIWADRVTGRVAWSPEGDRLAAGVRRPGRVYHLAFVDLEKRTLVESHEAGLGGAWSPDGLRFAYCGAPGSMATGRGPAAERLGVLDATSAMRRFVDSADAGAGFTWNGVYQPQWSPDGRWIAYLRFGQKPGRGRGWANELWLITADGLWGGRVAEDVMHFAWTPDSSGLAWTDDARVRLSRVAEVDLRSATHAHGDIGKVAFEAPVPLEVDSLPTAEYDAAPVLARNRAWLVPDATDPASMSYLRRDENAERTHAYEERVAWDAEIGMLLESRSRRRGTWGPWGATWTGPDGAESIRVTADGLAAFPGGDKPETLRERIAEKRRGLPFRCGAMAWAADPGAFVIRQVEGRPLQGETVLHIVPRWDKPIVQTPYSREEVERFELAVSNSDFRILRETDAADKVQLSFENYATLGDGAAPMRVVTQRGKHHGELLANVRNGAWMCTASVDSTDATPSTREISELTLPLPDAARARLKRRGAEIRALLEAAPPDREVPVSVYPYRFGHYYAMEGGRAYFTLHKERNVACVAEFDAPVRGPLVCVVFGEGARIIAAGQAEVVPGSASAEIVFPRHRSYGGIVSGDIRGFHLSLAGHEVRLATRSTVRKVPAWRFAPGARNVDFPPEGDGPVVRHVDVTTGMGAGILARTYSPSGGLLYDNRIVAVLWNDAGVALGASHEGASFMGNHNLDFATAELPLPPIPPSARGWFSLGGGGGGMATQLGVVVMFADAGPGASMEELLDAEIPDLWGVGVRNLQRDLVDVFHATTVSRGDARILPQRARLRRVLGAVEDAETQAGCVTLLAPVVEAEDVQRLLPLLQSGNDGVKDAAAVALALARDRAGVDRLPEIAARPPGERDSGRFLLRHLAIQAMSGLTSEVGVAALGRALEKVLDEKQGAGDWRHETERHQLARALAETGQPSAGPWLLSAMRRCATDTTLDAAIASGLASSSREAWAMEVFLVGVREGRGSFMSGTPGDPQLIPFTSKWLLEDSTEEERKLVALSLLGRIDDERGVPALRDAWDRYQQDGSAGLRVRIGTELLAHGDARGVERMLDEVVLAGKEGRGREAMDLAQLIGRSWFYPRRRQPPEALLSAVERRLGSSDANELCAILHVADELRVSNDGMRRAIRKLVDHPDPNVARLAERIADR